MCYECDRYSDYADDYTNKVNFYYALELVTSFNVANGREFSINELIVIENAVYSVVKVQDVNSLDGDKVASAVILTRLGAFENPQS